MVDILLAVVMCIQLHSIELDMQPAHATAYCIEGVTRSGEMTHEGICAAKEEWLGNYILVFQRLPDGKIGDFIGGYLVADTGGTQGLRDGKVVDIWKPDLDSCQEFMEIVYEDNCQGKIYICVLEPRK